jgi:flagellum-specific ATP synthase
MVDIAPPVHLEAADRLRQLLATYRTNQTLINIGLYRKGADPQIDMAVNYRESISEFLQQEIEEERPYDQSISTLCGLFG